MLYLEPILEGFRSFLVLTSLLVVLCGQLKAQEYKSIPATTVADAESGSSSAQDGLSGPVRRVRTEAAGLLPKDGKLVEGSRVLLEIVLYNRQGRKIDHSVHAVSSSQLAGKQVYKYDAQGNIVEMTVHGDDGSVISQERYAYEFDALGNWTKMTTSVAVVENNEVTYEPTEITYRAITYYRTDAVAKKIIAPAGPDTDPSRAPTANPAQKNEAPETGERGQVIGRAADGELQSASRQQAAPEQSTAPSATTVVPHPPAGKSDAEVGETGTEKAVAVGGSDKVERPAAESPAPKPPVRAVSGGVLNGGAIDLPKPVYPELAKRANTVGVVSVEVLIDVTGKVIAAKAVSGPQQLRGAAVEAAQRARFIPTLLSGQPVRVSGFINYNFSLKQ